MIDQRPAARLVLAALDRDETALESTITETDRGDLIKGLVMLAHDLGIGIYGTDARLRWAMADIIDEEKNA